VWVEARDRNLTFIKAIGRSRIAERDRLRTEAARADRVIAEINRLVAPAAAYVNTRHGP
jgi:hypothetical protein